MMERLMLDKASMGVNIVMEAPRKIEILRNRKDLENKECL
jgi:hypothetical protein